VPLRAEEAAAPLHAEAEGAELTRALGHVSDPREGMIRDLSSHHWRLVTWPLKEALKPLARHHYGFDLPAQPEGRRSLRGSF
jgi:hypothetical protein